MRLIDIHCHVLPFVDDGPDTLEEAIEILEESVRQGVYYMIMTPHYRREFFEPSNHQIMKSYQLLRKEASERGIQLFLGCEYFRDSEINEQIMKGRRVTLSRSPYILVEFSSQDTFTFIRNFTYNMKNSGYQPIIAHVERYESCWSLEKIQELKECGVEIQVNSSTVLGKHGWKNKRMCVKLMKNDLIDYIASDTHNTLSRAQNLGKCAEYVAGKMGKPYMKKIFYNNPSNILKSR